MSAIIDRILRQLEDEHILDKLLSLPKSDLNSLLLELFQMQAEKIAPTDIIKAYNLNRFSIPSNTNPVAYHTLEADLLSAAQGMGIETILLSPSAPFGSCSAFGCVDQKNVVSAMRGTETLSDPSNMLAIIIADKIKRQQTNHSVSLHYCTTARVVRAQAFSGEGFFAHFGLFSIVSSGKARNSYACEMELLIKQLTYYKNLFLEKYNAKLSVVLRKRSGYIDTDGFFERMAELIKCELKEIPIAFDFDHADNNYYKGINFKIYAERNGEFFEIGDGGFVNWIEKMTGNKKERCLISGIGIDRLLLL